MCLVSSEKCRIAGTVQEELTLTLEGERAWKRAQSLQTLWASSDVKDAPAISTRIINASKSNKLSGNFTLGHTGTLSCTILFILVLLLCLRTIPPATNPARLRIIFAASVPIPAQHLALRRLPSLLQNQQTVHLQLSTTLHPKNKYRLAPPSQ